MTALKPIENRNVRGASQITEKYPTNKTSSKPGSNEPATDVHHCFPRSQTKSDSYFVEIGEASDDGLITTIIPHATGLAHEEHMDVEDHRAWIRLEDGVWNWYERQEGVDGLGLADPDEWKPLGPLDPQPGELVPLEKKKRRVFKGEEKRNRQNWQIKVPQDALEDGAGILDDLLDQCREKLERLGLYDESAAATVPPYHVLVAALSDWITD